MNKGDVAPANGHDGRIGQGRVDLLDFPASALQERLLAYPPVLHVSTACASDSTVAGAGPTRRASPPARELAERQAAVIRWLVAPS